MIALPPPGWARVLTALILPPVHVLPGVDGAAFPLAFTRETHLAVGNDGRVVDGSTVSVDAPDRWARAVREVHGFVRAYMDYEPAAWETVRILAGLAPVLTPEGVLTVLWHGGPGAFLDLLVARGLAVGTLPWKPR